MNSFSIQSEKTAFVSVAGETQSPHTVWVVLHGYGQLAEYFIRHFEPLLEPGVLVLAPEAPSRFYLGSDYDRVGASWMTKRNREADVEDVNAYLDKVLDSVYTRFGCGAGTQFNFLGFSQGVPVLCRWLNRTSIRPGKLLLWAGSVPHDMPLPDLKALLSRGKSYLVYGTADEYLAMLKPQEIEKTVAEKGLPVQIKTFNGGHTLHAELLLDLSKE